MQIIGRIYCNIKGGNMKTMEIFDLLTTIAENSMICIFINRIYRENNRRRHNILLKIFVLIIFIFTTFILNKISIDKTERLFMVFVLGIVLTLFLYKTSLIKAFLNNIIWLIIIVLSNTIVGGFIMYIVHINIDIIMDNKTLYMIFVLFSLMVEFLFLVISSNIIIRHNIMLKYGKAEFIILGIWTTSSLITLIGALEVVYVEDIHNRVLNFLIFTMAVSALFFYIIIFFVFEKYVENKNMEKNKIIIENAKESLELYYSELEKENRKVRELYHDMKNHLMMYDEIRREDNELGNKYKENLLSKIKLFENYYHTGNLVLDILLKKKTEQAGDIRMDVLVQKESVKKFELADLCTIFSNALDNAIEHQIGREEHGWIRLRSSFIDNEVILIIFENPLYGQLVVKNGKIITSKHKKDNHGIGLISIQNIVKQYHGTVTINVENNIFCLIIRI